MHAPRKPKIVGAYEAKTKLPALLKQVERGHVIAISRHGKLIAKLVPAGLESPAKDIFDRILAFHGTIKLPKGESSKQLIEAGRRM